jgi:REP element-mobilizing transposase RayT
MQRNKLATSALVQRRNRRSIRLWEYDYSQAGAYYITVCTRDRECLFGAIAGGQMQVSEAGQIVQDVWCALPKFYASGELDAFVVMPNHVHGIIVIRDDVRAIHESPSVVE